jgi:hypothetical protein
MPEEQRSHTHRDGSLKPNKVGALNGKNTRNIKTVQGKWFHVCLSSIDSYEIISEPLCVLNGDNYALRKRYATCNIAYTWIVCFYNVARG